MSDANNATTLLDVAANLPLKKVCPECNHAKDSMYNIGQRVDQIVHCLVSNRESLGTSL